MGQPGRKALPLPRAGEGWGEGSRGKPPLRSPTRSSAWAARSASIAAAGLLVALLSVTEQIRPVAGPGVGKETIVEARPPLSRLRERGRGEGVVRARRLADCPRLPARITLTPALSRKREREAADAWFSRVRDESVS